MTSEYNAAQRLLHKIKQSVSEFELNNTGGNTNVVEAAVAQDLQTLSKGIAEYRILGRQESNERKRKTMLDRATSMADDHELLKRRFDKLKLRKNERENYTQERSELFQGGSGVALDTAITVDEDAFWGRSERALDGSMDNALKLKMLVYVVLDIAENARIALYAMSTALQQSGDMLPTPIEFHLPTQPIMVSVLGGLLALLVLALGYPSSLAELVYWLLPQRVFQLVLYTLAGVHFVETMVMYLACRC
ncbi:hypothetical protein H4S04_004110, partial [Coemansia sp. S16]